MAVDLDTHNLLADHDARQLFKVVADRRSIRLADLLKQVNMGGSRPRAKQALNRLQEKGLVAARPSGVLDDFDTYYVTAEGLEARRQVF